MNQEIEQVKERLDIAEVISSYLTLKRAGQNLKGLCPFHNEKTPSFMVNTERQIFKCFGCGEGGDVFTFIEKIEGVSFYNALKILADRAGVTLSQNSIHRDGKKYQSDSKTVLFAINTLAAKMYHKLLIDHPKAESARKYLKERGLSQQILIDFQIGFAPNSWDYIIRFMSSRGFKKRDLFKAGIVVENKSGDYYDRFRGRIIYPINNVMGNCVGFTSRVIVDDGEQAKYVNSAESEIYHKGKVLYALDKAKLDIRNKSMAVIAEGQMDVIACHQAGFKNVVASSGTAITEDQIRALSRYTNNIVFAFDSDTAGINAMKKAVVMALKLDTTPKIIETPQGFKDPDEVIRKDRKLWQRAVESARPALEVWIDYLVRDNDINDVSDRKKITREILPVIKQITTEVEKEYYIKYLSRKTVISESTLIKDMDKTKSDESNEEDENQKLLPLSIHQRILAIVWSDEQLAQLALSKVDTSRIVEEKDVSVLWQKFIEEKLTSKFLKDDEINLLDQWLYQLSRDYDSLNAELLKPELLYLLSRLKQEKNEDIKTHYSQLIKKAQEDGDKEQMKKLLNEFSRLIKE